MSDTLVSGNLRYTDGLEDGMPAVLQNALHSVLECDEKTCYGMPRPPSILKHTLFTARSEDRMPSCS